MLNLNKVKGTASKFEEMMSQEFPKPQKIPIEKITTEMVSNEDDDDYDDINNKENEVLCTCCNTEDDRFQSEQPTINDFVEIIEQSKILEDRESSIKLLFLIHVFVKEKLRRNRNILPSL